MKAGRDFIGLSVFGLVLNGEEEVLLGLNKYTEKKGKDYDGVWSMPGGTVEFGETAEETLVREVKEETNIDIEEIELFSYNDYIKPDEGKHWLALNFTAQAKNTKIINHEPDKFEKIEFVNPKKLTGKFSKFCEEALKANGLL